MPIYCTPKMLTDCCKYVIPLLLNLYFNAIVYSLFPEVVSSALAQIIYCFYSSNP